MLYDVVLKEPLASLAELGLAPHLIHLQVKLRLFVCWFCFHGSSSPFLCMVWMNRLHRPWACFSAAFSGTSETMACSTHCAVACRARKASACLRTRSWMWLQPVETPFLWSSWINPSAA